MTATEQSVVGARLARVEDARILTGAGRYIGDLSRPRMLEAAFVRSPHAHARVGAVDVAHALKSRGVVTVLTAVDVDQATEPHRFASVPEGLLSSAYRALAGDKARHVGDPVAVVIAESRALAEDACEAIEVDYEPLEPIVSVEDALDPSRPPVFDDLGTNVAYHSVKTFGDPTGAFAAADAVVRVRLDVPRVSHAPIDMRGGLADYDPATRTLVYEAGTRNPHGVKLALATLLRHPAERLHVIAPDIGGAFGQKAHASREDVVVCVAARRLGRPVRWIEDRIENLTAATQGRGERLEVAAAVTVDGTLLGLDVTAVFDQGAYPVQVPLPLVTAAMRVIIPGPYRIENVRWEETVIVTNKASFGTLRGPWAAESLMRETVIDAVARELSLDPVDIRRRNLLTPGEQPWKGGADVTIEGVTAAESLERAVELIGYDAIRAEQRVARGGARLRGIGIATYIEPAPGPPDYGPALGFRFPDEPAVAQLAADGIIEVITSQVSQGQGHETTIAQVAASELGVPVDRVRVVHGDTRVTPFSPRGTGGSRASSMATGAVMHAARGLLAQVLELAATILDDNAAELVGDAIVARDGSALTLSQLARAAVAEGNEAALRSSASYTSGRGGWSGGTHACVVEIDAETGVPEVTRYVVVEDCGKVINPSIVDGQIRGGVAQGLGIALLEDARYDEDGLPATTLMDYLLPATLDVPRIDIEHIESEPLHELDFRGVGESGTIAAPPAVVNAIADAVGGIEHVRLPLTPSRILDQIE